MDPEVEIRENRPAAKSVNNDFMSSSWKAWEGGSGIRTRQARQRSQTSTSEKGRSARKKIPRPQQIGYNLTNWLIKNSTAYGTSFSPASRPPPPHGFARPAGREPRRHFAGGRAGVC